jgi:hypothetical protein
LPTISQPGYSRKLKEMPDLRDFADCAGSVSALTLRCLGWA